MLKCDQHVVLPPETSNPHTINRDRCDCKLSINNYHLKADQIFQTAINAFRNFMNK